MLLKKIDKAQNVALRWIAGAFRTTPIPLLKLFSGIALAKVRLNYQLKNFLNRASTCPKNHPLRHLASFVPIFSRHAHLKRHKRRLPSDNIRLLQAGVKQVTPFALSHPLCRIGSRIIDRFHERISIVVPVHPPKHSDLFQTWLQDWKAASLDAINAANFCIASDASINKGRGTAAFAAFQHGAEIYHHFRPCAASSSFDAELSAILDAIEYTSASLSGKIIFVIDNKAALSKATDVSSHSGFPISLQIVKHLSSWLQSNHTNYIEFRWFPSHCGLQYNERADKLACTPFPRVAPSPSVTTASRLRHLKRTAVTEWRSQSAAFLARHHIRFKFKRKAAVPQLWGKSSRQFINAADNDISLLSRFTRLTSGHAPIGSYRQKFFPDKSTECSCGHPLQDVEHLSSQCPLVSAKFSSFSIFLFGKNNVTNILTFLKENLTVASFEGQPLDLDRPP